MNPTAATAAMRVQEELAGRELDAIVFDMDGTLIDSAQVVPDAYMACAAELGLERELRRQDVIDLYPLGAPAHILAELLGRRCCDEELALYHAHLTALSGGVRPYAGMLETLQVLAALLPLAVFTGGSAASAEILLGGAGLAPHFRELLGGDLVANPKPHPDGVLLACDRLGVDPARTAYVGDSPLDQGAARAAGALAVAAGWGHLFEGGPAADLVLDAPSQLVLLAGAAAAAPASTRA